MNEIHDERGPYERGAPGLALTGLAGQLADATSKLVDEICEPLSMDTIRQLARAIVRKSELHSSFDEFHYVEYGQWFTRMTFRDGSHITWGECEE